MVLLFGPVFASLDSIPVVSLSDVLFAHSAVPQAAENLLRYLAHNSSDYPNSQLSVYRVLAAQLTALSYGPQRSLRMQCVVIRFMKSAIAAPAAVSVASLAVQKELNALVTLLEMKRKLPVKRLRG